MELHTILPAVSPFLEAFQEDIFGNAVQLGHIVPHNDVTMHVLLFLWLKSGPFQWQFQLEAQSRITRTYIGRVGCLMLQGNVAFGQENLNQMQTLGRWIAMMDLQVHVAHESGCVHCTLY